MSYLEKYTKLLNDAFTELGITIAKIIIEELEKEKEEEQEQKNE